jgi:hypothetical protein
LFAKERQGVQLVITKTDGTKIKGELIGLKQDSTLILESSSTISGSIDLSEIKIIRIVKGSIPLAGVIVGLVGGGVVGQAIGKDSGSYGSRPIGLFVGGLVGGIVGGVITSHNDEILIGGKSQEQIKAFLEKLRKKARFPDYQ